MTNCCCLPQCCLSCPEWEKVERCLKIFYAAWKKLVNIIRQLPEEVESLKAEQKTIQAFIEAAAGKDLTPDEHKDLMLEIETAFNIEDIIYEYESYERWRPHRDLRIAASPCNIDLCLHCKTTPCLLYIKWKIRGVKSKIEEIKRTQARKKSEAFFNMEPSLNQTETTREVPDTWWQNLRAHPDRRMDNYEIVGLLEDPDKLVRCLNDEASSVITVMVGMGGLGKTTLALQVFDNLDSKKTEGFLCPLWITVSEFSDKEKLLDSMFEQFSKKAPLGDTSTDQSSNAEKLRIYLEQTRYVVFFDDVRSEQFWEEIRYDFRNMNVRSRIIITTRNKDVVPTCRRSSSVKVLEIKPLSEGKSLELLNKTAFRFRPDSVEEHLVICRRIVERCTNLPLAIVAIGREISGDPNFPTEWESQLKKTAAITKILSLSYDDLPEYLKRCLRYFGMYPANCEVKSKRLIRQWIAEGFIMPTKDKTAEKVAEESLKKLFDKNLVQVSLFTIDGKIKTCHAHPLVHTMILRICEANSFCHFIEDNKSYQEEIFRRLAIATTSQENLNRLNASASSNDSMRIIYSQMRSLLFFTQQELAVFEYTRSVLTRCEKLMVLDFEGALLSDVPEIIGNSIQLKYLSFRNTEVGSLPRSIGKLKHIETLDLRQTPLTMIPNYVCKLRKLRHLMGCDMSLIQLKGSIGNMDSLQTLRSVKIDGDGGLEIIKELRKLGQMRDLKLTDVMTKHASDLCSSLNEMQDLEKLHIVAKTEESGIDLKKLKKRKNLRKLHLKGKLSMLPQWIPELGYLVQVVLSMSKLADEALCLLKQSQSLLFLSIVDGGYEGAELRFKVGEFNYLKELKLGSLNSLKSIIIESKALKALNKLELKNIPQLKEVPSGIQHLEKLEDITIQSMSVEFMQSIDANRGQKDSIIKPRVRINM